VSLGLKTIRSTSEIRRIRGPTATNSLETFGRSVRRSVIVFGVLFKVEGRNVRLVKISFSTIQSLAPDVAFEEFLLESEVLFPGEKSVLLAEFYLNMGNYGFNFMRVSWIACPGYPYSWNIYSQSCF